MKAYFKFSILFVVVSLFILGCSVTKPEKDESPHPNIKATLQIPGSIGTRSVKTQGLDDYVELYITEFGIGEDAEPRGLWFIGRYIHTGSKGGQNLDNAGWYNVTTPKTLTVVNDFNPGQYSAIGLQIQAVKGRINGVEFETSGIINRFAEYKDWAWILYTNDFVPPVFSWPYMAEFVSWNPIVVQNNHKELIATLEMNIANILKPGTTELIDKWWERITITTELK